MACLLANAFFCTFPRRNQAGHGSEYDSYPSINFSRLFSGNRHHCHPVQAAKLKCIIAYFQAVTNESQYGRKGKRKEKERKVFFFVCFVFCVVIVRVSSILSFFSFSFFLSFCSFSVPTGTITFRRKYMPLWRQPVDWSR